MLFPARRPASAGRCPLTHGDNRPLVTDLYETANSRWVRRVACINPQFSPDGRKLMGQQGDRIAVVYDTDTGRLLTRFEDVTCPRWMQDSRCVIGENGVVWDTEGHAARGRFSEQRGENVFRARSRPDWPWQIEFAHLSDYPPLRTGFGWRLADGRWRWAKLPSRTCESNGWLSDDGRVLLLSSLRVHPAGRVGDWVARQHPSLASLGSGDESVRSVLDPNTGYALAILAESDIYASLSADGKNLYTMADPGDVPSRIRVWDLPTRPPVRWVAGLAVGWAVVLLFVALRWRRPRICPEGSQLPPAR